MVNSCQSVARSLTDVVGWNSLVATMIFMNNVISRVAEACHFSTTRPFPTASRIASSQTPLSTSGCRADEASCGVRSGRTTRTSAASYLQDVLYPCRAKTTIPKCSDTPARQGTHRLVLHETARRFALWRHETLLQNAD